jgi:hypothetical protein
MKETTRFFEHEGVNYKEISQYDLNGCLLRIDCYWVHQDEEGLLWSVTKVK